MSGMVDKIKAKVEDVLHKDHTTSTSNTTHTGAGTGHNTHHGQHHTAGNGPHDSSTANAVDPRVDSNTGYNTTGTSSGYGQSGYTGGSTNAGPHDSNIANKLDPRVDSDRDGSRTANQGYGTTGSSTTGYGQSGYTGGSTNAGPHDSNIANKLDPRVDSDRDGSRTANQGYGTTGSSTTGYGHQSGYTGGSTNAGPHDSNIANKLDPRVDSDRDGSRTTNQYGTNQGYGTTGSSTTGYGHQSGYTGGSTNAGPHDSNIANKLDPRVDSDRDGSRTTNQYGTNQGYGTTGSSGYGQSGYTGTSGSTTAGPHSSNMANKLDPRVDSDADGSRNFGAAQHGPGATHNAATGPARDTAGPHSSNVLNKLDPRVDSDADGSRNFGAAQHGAGGQYNNNSAQGGFGGNSTY